MSNIDSINFILIASILGFFIAKESLNHHFEISLLEVRDLLEKYSFWSSVSEGLLWPTWVWQLATFPLLWIIAGEKRSNWFFCYSKQIRRNSCPDYLITPLNTFVQYKMGIKKLNACLKIPKKLGFCDNRYISGEKSSFHKEKILSPQSGWIFMWAQINPLAAMKFSFKNEGFEKICCFQFYIGQFFRKSWFSPKNT